MDDKVVEAVKDELCMLSKMHGFPSEERQLDRVARAVARFASTESVKHPNLGEVVPLEWLIDEVLDRCEFFPPPLRMRRIYEQSFPPLDKRSSADLEETR